MPIPGFWIPAFAGMSGARSDASLEQPVADYMLRQIATVSAGTLSSRLLGFVRDTLMASLLGAGPAADAFLFAFQLVNVARRLISEGAFNAIMVPAYLRVRQTGGKDSAQKFAGGVLGTTTAALIGVTAVFGLAMPLVVSLLAPGFAGHDSHGFAITTARLMLPYLAFAGPVAVIMALLNAEGRVAQSAFTPLLFNIVLILVTLGLLIAGGGDAENSATILAVTVGAAGLAQAFVLAFPGARMAHPVRLTANADVLQLLRRTLPGALAQSGPQLLVVAGAIAASLTPGSVAAIYFANRLIELPLGIVGVAAGTVVLTRLSDRALRDDADALQSRAIESALALALPAAIGLAVLAQPIVMLLFRHGAFTAGDAGRTALALAILSAALPAHALTKILAPAFFAREDFRAPLMAMLAGLAVATVAAILLQSRYAEAGVATAIAAGAWISAVVLIVMLSSRRQLAWDRRVARRLLQIVIAAAVMGAVLYVARIAGGIDQLTSFAALVGSVAALIAAGLALYLILLQLSGVFRVDELVRSLRKDP
jgi:putative peptidoglycan lipid II flippase